jgi:amino-acid N-acetyltransferase
MIAIARARPSDEEAIRDLLRASGLPTEDLAAGSFDRFLAARSEGTVVGAVGFETYGAIAMVRSLAVSPECRKQGVASKLLSAAEQHAASDGADTLFGLTMTAEGFLAKRGYERIERVDAPDEIRRTAEFTGLCPESAVLMRKILD